MIEIESKYWERGLLVAGVDEAGRGPIAGPVVASAVILKPFTKPFIRGDSKALSSQEREEAYEIIKEKAIALGTAVVDNIVIDKMNILRATKLAMNRALEDLKYKFDVVISDYVNIEGMECIAIPKADEKSLSCACASIVAKVLRDKIMREYHRIFPQYNFESHKGYITRDHIERLKKYNISPIHRRSFKPIRQDSLF